jgi:small ligand-binding sensory domain FIST
VPFASAISEHPITAHATGEVAGQALETVGVAPDLVVLFVTPPHAGALEDAAGAVRAILEPRTLVGCAAESVAGINREVEGGPAVCLWAGRFGPVVPVGLDVATSGGGGAGVGDVDGDRQLPVTGWPDEVPFDPAALFLLADPFTFPVEAFIDWFGQGHPGLPVIGGMASAAQGPGGNRLVLDGKVRVGGAVGALLGPGVELASVVSQGCRPVGHPLAVTRAEGNVVYELGGQPALERLVELARRELAERDVALINAGGLHLGRVIDEHKAEFGRGDFLVRNVIGADRAAGAIAVNDVVELGTTVQFHLRDAVAADEDLRSLLSGRQADAALMFTCNGRGTRLFGSPHHDASALADTVGEIPMAGFFAAGELGPVGGRNFLHGFTASIALLQEVDGRREQEPAG